MSRIGKHPVEVPEGVNVNIAGQQVTVKGKLGQLSVTLVDEVLAELDGDRIWVKPRDESKHARTMWGMSRSLVNNVVVGVSAGFTVRLEINGVGYRAAVQGQFLNLQLGYSHEINHPIPEGITVKCARPTLISVSGADRQKVGQFAAQVRAYRKPEPYKGKGIRYEGEYVRRKEGKKK
jgi:large subunit ribosomal protein L6